MSVETAWAEFFEGMLESEPEIEPKVAANWLTGELAAELRRQDDISLGSSPVTPANLARLVGMVQTKRVSNASAKDVLVKMVSEGADPEQVVVSEGLEQISDSGELESIVDAVIEANPGPAGEVRGGNEKAIGALVGAVMKEAGGRVDGGEVNRLLRERLTGD
jgi:aspartyl-tRNA(Asn)/glutamyl-tRNA(Gln) amidotransferase subunit B